MPAVDEPGDVPLLDPLGVGGGDEREGRVGPAATITRRPPGAGLALLAAVALAVGALVAWPRGAGESATPPTTATAPTTTPTPDPAPATTAPRPPADDPPVAPSIADPEAPVGAGLPASATGRAVVLSGRGTVSVAHLDEPGRTVTVAVDGPPSRSLDGDEVVAVGDGRLAVVQPSAVAVLDQELRPTGPELPTVVTALVAGRADGRVWTVRREPTPPLAESRGLVELVELADGAVVAAVPLSPGERVVGATVDGVVLEDRGRTVSVTVDGAGAVDRRPVSSGHPIAVGPAQVALVECDAGFRCLLAVRRVDGSALRTLPFGASAGAIEVLDASVSPDGSSLAILVRDPASTVDGDELLLVELVPGGDLRRIAAVATGGADRALAWSADGRVLVWGVATEGGVVLGVHDVVERVTGSRTVPVGAGRVVAVLG